MLDYRCGYRIDGKAKKYRWATKTILTPWGDYTCWSDAARACPFSIQPDTVSRWCRSPNKIIGLPNLSSVYLKSRGTGTLGKTFAELGFGVHVPHAAKEAKRKDARYAVDHMEPKSTDPDADFIDY